MRRLPKLVKHILIFLLSIIILLFAVHVNHWIACHFADVSEGYYD